MSKDLIRRQESSRYPGLFVKKYTKRVFFDNLWSKNSELMEARGHVEDARGNIVVRPFTKIFNRGENGTDIDRDEQVVAIRKVNGFMAAATYVASVNDVVVSTTGSLDSDFVKYAEQYINATVKYAIKSHYVLTGKLYTWMFEICHPSDPHIVPEKAGAYLIGKRRVDLAKPYFSTPEQEAELDHHANAVGIMRPDWGVFRFSDVVDESKRCQHEGFVVYGQTSNTALKIKSPYYLVLKACARKKDIMSLNKEIVDEEYYGLIDFLRENQDEFNSLTEQDRLTYMTDWLTK